MAKTNEQVAIETIIERLCDGYNNPIVKEAGESIVNGLMSAGLIDDDTRYSSDYDIYLPDYGRYGGYIRFLWDTDLSKED